MKKKDKLQGRMSALNWELNELYIHNFIKEGKDKTYLPENHKPNKWRKGRVPYWYKKLNSIFNTG